MVLLQSFTVTFWFVTQRSGESLDQNGTARVTDFTPGYKVVNLDKDKDSREDDPGTNTHFFSPRNMSFP